MYIHHIYTDNSKQYTCDYKYSHSGFNSKLKNREHLRKIEYFFEKLFGKEGKHYKRTINQ